MLRADRDLRTVALFLIVAFALALDRQFETLTALRFGVSIGIWTVLYVLCAFNFRTLQNSWTNATLLAAVAIVVPIIGWLFSLV